MPCPCLVRLLLAAAALVCAAAPASAHPVPRSAHDRTITVRLRHDPKTEQLTVTVAYRLEVEELTVVLEDMVPFSDEVDFAKYRNRPLDFYAEYARIYAPILAKRLDATLDGTALKFECVQKTQTLRDEEGRALGHLRCDFEFRATAALAPGKKATFKFRDGTWETQAGIIDVSLSAGGGVALSDMVQASDALKKLPPQKHAPGDDDRLRSAGATIAAAARTADPAPAAGGKGEGGLSLKRLFGESDQYAIWVLLLLAVVFGAAHALTPGHGKTLVAAYLIGERGTVWHALVLGLVTTFTHTFAVIALAICLLLFGPEETAGIQMGLGLVLGLTVACFGFWLLLQRLSGRADHFHIGGHGHGHGHGHGEDVYDSAAPRRGAGGWGLIAMGIQGGLVPCWDAIAVLSFAVMTGKLWLAVPLLLAFSAGLAGVLVAVGVLVVRSKRFAESRWGEGRLVKALPVLSAVCVTLLGLWLCYESIHPEPPA